MGDQGDGGFDPCACMWNHDLAMQRLLSIVSFFNKQYSIACSTNNKKHCFRHLRTCLYLPLCKRDARA